MVHEFLRRLIPEIQKLIAGLNKIHNFLDGCTGQYKNKLNFINIAHPATDFGTTGEWHFFATSWDKSAHVMVLVGQLKERWQKKVSGVHTPAKL